METSVLIQVPYELESAYSPLEERTDIDYTVMSVDNFNVGDFLIGLYITISSNSIITGVVSGMIWDVIKIVSHDVLDKLPIKKMVNKKPVLKYPYVFEKTQKMNIE